MDPENNDNNEGENIEMNDLNDADWHNLSMELDSMGFGKDEEDTSFIEKSNRLLDNDGVLEMTDDNNLFEGEGNELENRLKNLKKKTVGVMKRYIISDKKQFISKVFGVKVNKGAGLSSKLLYNELKITTGEKSGKINGAMYKGKKILILMKGGRMEYSKAKVNSKLIMEFKNTLNGALEENKKNPGSIVEDHIPHEISEETSDNIRMKAANDMEEAADLLLNQAENNTYITKQEISELRGAVVRSWGEIIEAGDKDLIRSNLKALDIESRRWKKKSLEAKAAGDPGREALYDVMAKAVELKADRVRTVINEKPKGDLAVEILNEEADVSEASKFDKFKKWSKENLLGLSAITITIAGILVTIFSAARTVVKGGASALSKFAKAVASIASKFGPVIAAVGSVLASILMAGTTGLLWLAKNLWLLAIAFAYFLYSEYKSRKNKK